MTEAETNRLAQVFEEYFIAQGCRVDVDPAYQERYNIDFGVSRIKGVHAAVNLGVHITPETDNFSKQEIMLEAAKRGVVARSVYVEVCATTMDTGVIPVTYTACLAFVFDRRYQHASSIGIRVFEDSTFHYFDIEENVRRLRKGKHDTTHSDTESLKGEIIAYFTDKGFGFIEETDQQKFFFHIANVVDDSLREELPNYVQGDTIPVQFHYGGSEGKKYPKAIDVALREY